MNGKPAVTDIVGQFIRKKVWSKLYGPLASDWLSIREASMEVDATRDKGYTLNRSVQLCINELKNTKYLEMRKITKVKESTTKVGTPRKYTSTCLRHKLNVVKLWFDFLAENCLLKVRERALLKSILREPEVERVLRNRNMGPRDALSLLVRSFYFVLRKETLKTLEKKIKKFALEDIPLYIERIGVEGLDKKIEPDRENKDAYMLMEGFLKFLSQNEAKFAALDSLNNEDKKRFLRTLTGELFKDFLKQSRDNIRIFFPGFLKDEDKKGFLDALMSKLSGNKLLSIQLSEGIAKSFEQFF